MAWTFVGLIWLGLGGFGWFLARRSQGRARPKADVWFILAGPFLLVLAALDLALAAAGRAPHA